MDNNGFGRETIGVPNEAPHFEDDFNARIGSMALNNNLEPSEETKSDKEAVARKFIKRYGPMLSLFAKDSSLKFEPSFDAETFAFYPKEFKVEVPLSWFASEKYNEDELSFANHHEIAHFIDMRQNPEAYIENFEQMEQDSKELAKEYLRNHPDCPASEESVKNFFYSEIHSLYNVLDDIYVNNLVMSRNRFFDTGDGRDDIETLYGKIGFGEADMTLKPLHQQMIFSLLRDEMLGETHGKSVVDERVEEVLSKEKLGKTIRELIDTELKPRRGELVDPAERYKRIRRLIQPEFIELLEESLEQQEFNPFGDDKKAQDSGGILDHGDDWEQTVRKILDSFKEADMIDKMSKEERTEYQRQKAIKEFDDEHDISESERQEIEEIQSEISGARKKMRRFWEGLIGKSIEYRRTRIKSQRKGRLNVNSAIQKYPEIIESERNGSLRNLEIYDRIGLERKVVDQPETIDVSLLVDCSGSMRGTGEEAAKRTAALLMYSIKDFNDELEKTRRETQSKLRANTEVIVFGSDFEEVKSFERQQDYDGNDAEIIKSISKIDSKRDSTDDAAPLGEMISRLSQEEKVRIKQAKLKKIVFEVTDGVSDDPEETKARLERLARDGVIVVGFQIGDVDDSERELFDEIWNEGNNLNKKGIFIGEDIASLPEALMRELSKLLDNIVI